MFNLKGIEVGKDVRHSTHQPLYTRSYLPMPLPACSNLPVPPSACTSELSTRLDPTMFNLKVVKGGKDVRHSTHQPLNTRSHLSVPILACAFICLYQSTVHTSRPHALQPKCHHVQMCTPHALLQVPFLQMPFTRSPLRAHT